MDKQLRYAKISKIMYKIIYKPRLFRFDISKKFPSLARRQRKSMEKFIPFDDALICLPKDEVIINQKVDKQGDMVLPTQVIEHFIDESNYRAIMNYCICRESNNCKDYPHDLGCLFLGEAAKGIHPEMCRSVTKEEAKEHVRKARKHGLVHLIGRAKLDDLWLDIGPHDKLFTICNCCPCCCISIAVPYISPVLTDWFYRMPGISVTVTEEECIGCGKCLDACIYGGITLEGEIASINDQCRGCGRCVEVCPQKAIKLHWDKSSVKQTIDFLASRVSVK